MSRLAEKVRRLPDEPGVYFFLGRAVQGGYNPPQSPLGKGRRVVLYIGKATSLRDRVRSYFAPNLLEARGPLIAEMVGKAVRVDFQRTDSVLEALLLEAEMIKRHQPSYNTELKDDKSFNCVCISNEPFPTVFIERSGNLDFARRRLKTSRALLKVIYGPYPDGLQLRAALKIIRKIFPYRDLKCILPPLSYSGVRKKRPKILKPCFSRQIGLCPGVCTGEITRMEYAKIIRNLRLFFEGKKKRLLQALKTEMTVAAKMQEFERAGEMKRQLFALQHIQDMALLKATHHQRATANFRLEAYDLSHLGGKEIVGAMAVVENGTPRPSEYRLFKIRSIVGPHETAGLAEILRRRFSHPEWPAPQLIVVDGNEVQKRAAERVLVELGISIPVVAVVKDERHRPREILGDLQSQEFNRTKGATVGQIHSCRAAILLANSEAHRFALSFHRKRRGILAK